MTEQSLADGRDERQFPVQLVGEVIQRVDRQGRRGGTNQNVSRIVLKKSR